MTQDFKKGEFTAKLMIKKCCKKKMPFRAGNE